MDLREVEKCSSGEVERALTKVGTLDINWKMRDVKKDTRNIQDLANCWLWEVRKEEVHELLLDFCLGLIELLGET